MIYITNSNFWNTYHICDFTLRKVTKTGSFENLENRLFGVFGLAVYKNLIITTGSSFATQNTEKQRDYSHIRVSKIDDYQNLSTKVLKISNLGSL